ncbi:MAG TPA: DUF1349 domain-containing protein [Gaiellaceae bacterium]
MRLDAGPRTDLFVDPQGADPILNAPRSLSRAEGVFQLSARVQVDFAATFDAGVLLVWFDERTWAKLCLEYSPEHEPMVVSVVTRERSDDCNSFVVPSGDVWLRVSRLAPSAFAFHASREGERWELIRHFSLGDGDDPEVGYMAQSPRGDGCTATFTELRFVPERLDDLRSGL